MDTWQQIHCEDIYDDTWFLRAELAAWEDSLVEQINLELAELASESRQYEIT